MMTNTRPGLRAIYAEQTRNRILEGFAACLEVAPHENVSVRDIAERVGVAEKTIYRHFPTRPDLLAGLSRWSRENFLPVIPAKTVDDLPSVFAEAVRLFETRPELARALALTEDGREVLSGLREQITARLRQLVDESMPNLSAPERRRLVAALTYLDNAYAWLVLRDRLDMDAAEISEVIGWIMRLVIDVTRESAGRGVTHPAPEGDI